MTAVPWNDLSPEMYERMVAVLLSHLHPESKRIDGTGGDGGRDVQIETVAGIQAFELKSFTGRVSQKRRTQIQKSLLRAKILNPVSWTLILPIDFTADVGTRKGEDSWFDGLRKLVPFPIDYCGLTWLDGKFAERWFIARYFLDHLSDEIVRLAELLDQERSALTAGVPEAGDRAARVVQQANELDPFYRFEITSDGSGWSIRVFPRYVGAEADRPITAEVTFSFPDDDAGRTARAALEKALDFGTEATVVSEYVQSASVDAPAHLGGLLERVEKVVIGPSLSTDDETRSFILACSRPDGRVVAELPVEARRSSVGRRGSILAAQDRTGILVADMTVDVMSKKLRIVLRTNLAPYYPGEMRPLARFLAAYGEPNVVTVRDVDGTPISEPTPAIGEPWMKVFMLRVIDDLALLQWASGVVRKVGPDFRREDLIELEKAARLLRGEALEVTWDRIAINLNPKAPQESRARMLAGNFDLAYQSREPYTATIAGATYRLGKAVRTEIPSARLESVSAEWATAGTIPDNAPIVYVPDRTDAGRVILVTDSTDAGA